MTSLGSQIGQFVERCRAERGVRESEARKTAILNAAFDCIVTMDGDGNIVEVNAATETTFGYSAEEMVGRELAELMIPPGKLREDHRRGPAALHGDRRLADRRPPGRAHGHARRRQHVPRRAGRDAPRPPRPGALLRLPARRDRAPPGRARPAGDGRGAGRAAPGGHGGRRRGRARAALRPHRRGGRARARRAASATSCATTATAPRWSWACGARAPATIPVGTTLVLDGETDRPARSGAPIARRATTASTARPAALAEHPALDRDQGGRRSARDLRRRRCGAR